MKDAILGIVIFLLIFAGVYAFLQMLRDGGGSDREPIKYATRVLVWIDPDTGCHYLTRDGYITPRLSGDGKQLCIL